MNSKTTQKTMRSEEIFRRIANEKVVKIEGSTDELQAALCRILAGASSRSISIGRQYMQPRLFIWQRPSVTFVSKAHLPFISSK